MERNLVS